MGAVLAAYFIQEKGIHGSAKENTRSDSSVLPVLGNPVRFSLTNQAGAAVSHQAMLGSIWLADIIFTRCPGPCARMTKSMAELQSMFASQPDVRFISLTTDPDFDSSAVLEAYGRRFGAGPKRWQFLTGTKAEIARLAANDLRLTALSKEESMRMSPEDLFIHSTIFVLLDKRGRLRASFETGGEGVDWGMMKSNILAAVEGLRLEN